MEVLLVNGYIVFYYVLCCGKFEVGKVLIVCGVNINVILGEIFLFLYFVFIFDVVMIFKNWLLFVVFWG